MAGSAGLQDLTCTGTAASGRPLRVHKCMDEQLWGAKGMLHVHREL